MVFTDQMLQPRRILQVPKDLAPPRVNLGDGGTIDDVAAAGLPSSPLGVWYLDGCDSFIKIAETILEYHQQQDSDGRHAGTCEDLYDKIARLVQMNALPLGVSGNYTEARGRRNVNLKAVPPTTDLEYSEDSCSDSFEEKEKVTKVMLQRLQAEAAKIAKQASRRMEVWLDLSSGSMQRAHEKGPVLVVATVRLPYSWCGSSSSYRRKRLHDCLEQH
jgi:hypothetical protein